MRVDFSKFLRCFYDLFFTVVLLSQYIRCNNKATVSACMSLVCLAHRLYHCTVSNVFVLTLFQQINDDDDDGLYFRQPGPIKTQHIEQLKKEKTRMNTTHKTEEVI